MRPVRKKLYQEYTFAYNSVSQQTPLELDDDGLVSFKLEHLSWSCLIGEVLWIAPHTPQWERLSLSMSSHIHDHNIDGKLQAYDIF
jgi:hypothetical protein